MKKRRMKFNSKLSFNFKKLKDLKPKKTRSPKKMQAWIGEWRNMMQFKSIAKQLVVLFLLTILVPVIVTMVVSTSTSSNEMIKQAKDQLGESNIKTSDYMSLLLDQIELLEMQFEQDGTVDNFLLATRPDTKVAMATATKELSARLSSLIETNPYIAAIYLITDTDYLVGYPLTYRGGDLSDIRSKEWYQKIESSNQPIWIDEHEGIAHSDVTYITSISYYFQLARVNFVAIFDIDEDALLKELENESNSSDTHDYQTFVITPMGKILSSEGVIEDPLFEAIREDALNTSHQVGVKSFQGSNHVVAYTKADNGWTVVNMLPESIILESVHAMRNYLIILGVLFAIIAVMIGVVAAIRMTRDLKEVMASMQKAEQGDLTVEVNLERKDEIGVLSDTFKTMLEHIRHLVSTSQQVATEVNVATAHIAARTKQSTGISVEIQKAIENVAEGAFDQSKEIDESVQLVTELSNKINLVVSNIEEMSQDSNRVQVMTDKGIETVSHLIEKNDQANVMTAEVVTSMDELNTNVQDISKITKLLRNISEETKLLSLNASIEAARVGEMGRGFAVVANEVSKLASQSAQSTKEIEAITERILNQSKKSVEAVKKSETINSEQYEAVHDSTQAFNDIKNTIGAFVGKMNMVLDYVEEMNTYKVEVENRMVNIASVSQMTAASTEEVTASVEEQTSSLDEILNDIEALASRSKDLTNTLKDFIVEKE